MSEKILSTRIRLKYDSYSNWTTNNPVLLAGEVAFATITSGATQEVNSVVAPQVIIKVGDGVSPYNTLPFTSAKAADVHGWAKKSEAEFIEWVKTLVTVDDIDLSAYALKTDVEAEAERAAAAEKANADAIAAILNGTEIDSFADVEAELAKKVDKVEGSSLVADTEIARLAAMSDGANKVEASETNGSIKIDGVDTVVYTHPEKHTIAEVDGLQVALDGKDAAGAAAQALVDAKAYADGLAGNYDAAGAAATAEQNAKDYADGLAGNYDATGSAATAESNAKAYADGLASNYDAAGAADTALADAKTYVNEQDVFEIDMLTVNAHGGVAAGTDLNGMTTHEILKKILYPYVEPSLGNATASPNGGTYEKGVTKTITSVSISVTKKSEAITSVALYNGSTLIEEKTGDAVKNGGTITFSNVNVEVPTNGNQLTVKVTDAANKTYSKNTTAMTFVYPYYMGSCAAGTAIDETLVESLTKKVESKGNKSNTFTVSDGHMVFAYPKAHGVLKNIIDPNNFETIGNYTRSEVSVTGLDGTAQTYYVYVSGATTVSGFTVNFKY